MGPGNAGTGSATESAWLNEEANVTGPDTPPVLPEYGGSADRGVVGSVGEHSPAAGDVVEALRAEHDKLHGVFEEVRALVRTQDVEALRLRWGGVVRELVEHETAEGRVVLPAAERAGEDLSAVRRSADDLLERLRRHDALTADDVDPQEVEQVLDRVAEHLRTVDDVVVPLLERLPAQEQMQLGEDLRQVMG